jgi:hypothetical protein
LYLASVETIFSIFFFSFCFKVAEEVIVSIRTVFSFAMEQGEHRRYRRKIQEYYVLVVAQIFIQGVYVAPEALPLEFRFWATVAWLCTKKGRVGAGGEEDTASVSTAAAAATTTTTTTTTTATTAGRRQQHRHHSRRC